MNFGTKQKKNFREQHKEGNRYNAEVKALIDAGVHDVNRKFEECKKYTQVVIHMQAYINPKHL